MKKIGLAFSFILFFSVSFQVSAQWAIELNGSKMSKTNVHIFDYYNLVVSSGYPATVHRTSDLGNNWTMIPLGLNSNIEDMIFINSEIGWVVGEQIFKTTDGGWNWFKQESGEHVMLIATNFIDDQIGWVLEAGGTKLLKTTDGGLNWSTVSQTLNQFGYALDIKFLNASEGFSVTSDGKLLKTLNGGVNWDIVLNMSPFGYRKIDINNNGIGYIIGNNGIIFKTTDSGTNWNQINSQINENLVNVSIINDYLTFIIGSDGGVYKSTDAGNSWIQLSYSEFFKVFAVDFLYSSYGWAVGDQTLLKTTDSGNNWFPVYDWTINSFTDIKFVNSKVGIIVSPMYYLIYITSNRGKSWNINQINGYESEAISFCDSLNGIIVGNGTVLRTFDGGQTWEDFSQSRTLGFDKVDFVSPNYIYAIAHRILSKSSDGGTSWNNINFPDSQRVYNLDFVDESIGYLTSDSLIYKTTDAGIHWEKQSLSTYNNLMKVKFLTPDFGVTVGWNGFLSITTNGGITWNKKISGTGSMLLDIEIINENTIVAVGYDGIVIKTTDGGENWDIQQIILSNLYSVEFINENEGWIVGGSCIFHTTNGGVTFIEEENNFTQPRQFLLQQNYPNPFNPSTKISWQSPVSGWQTLKVYDILGNEVATLVDEYRNAGSYELDFQSTVGSHQLANGVYFYQLRVGDFVETKKMILLK